MSLTVALIADVHGGPDSAYVRGSAALALLERALGDLEPLSPALLVDLGDRVNETEPEPVWAATAAVAEHYRDVVLPKAFVLGNHDLMPQAEQEALFGVPMGNRVLEFAGWRLVFLDTFDGSVEGVVGGDTLAWLEHTLSESTLPVVVFSHQPLDGQPLPGNLFFGGADAHQAHPRGHQAARRVMERSCRVKLAVSGHAHWNHRVTVGGIPYLTLDALVPPAGSQADTGNYGLLTLTDEFAQLEVFGRSPWRARLDLEVQR